MLELWSVAIAVAGLFFAGILKGATGLGYASCALPFSPFARFEASHGSCGDPSDGDKRWRCRGDRSRAAKRDSLCRPLSVNHSWRDRRRLVARVGRPSCRRSSARHIHRGLCCGCAHEAQPIVASSVAGCPSGTYGVLQWGSQWPDRVAGHAVVPLHDVSAPPARPHGSSGELGRVADIIDLDSRSAHVRHHGVADACAVNRRDHSSFVGCLYWREG